MMGCWPRSMEITNKGYDAMLDIFTYDGKITSRHPYDQVCVRV